LDHFRKSAIPPPVRKVLWVVAGVGSAGRLESELGAPSVTTMTDDCWQAQQKDFWLAEAYARFFLEFEAAPVLIVNAADIDPVGSETDYASLRMPKETRHYIPKLQALENIIANPAAYGVDLDAIPNQPYFAVINDTPDIDVHLAARLAEMPIEEFIALNPGFSRPLIRSASAKRLILPADKVVAFYDNLDNLDEADLVSWKVYQPERGENLDAIAKRFEISLAQLRRVNGIHPSSSKVPAELVVPINDGAKASLEDLPLMYAPPIPHRGPARAVHVVKSGDTLGSIAKRYRTSVSALKAGNQLGPFLQVGQKIYIR